MDVVFPYLALLLLGEAMAIFCFSLACAFVQAVAEWWRERKRKKDGF